MHLNETSAAQTVSFSSILERIHNGSDEPDTGNSTSIETGRLETPRL